LEKWEQASRNQKEPGRGLCFCKKMQPDEIREKGLNPVGLHKRRAIGSKEDNIFFWGKGERGTEWVKGEGSNVPIKNIWDGRGRAETMNQPTSQKRGGQKKKMEGCRRSAKGKKKNEDRRRSIKPYQKKKKIRKTIRHSTIVEPC